MDEQHYQEKLSAYLDHKLAPDEREIVAAHLLRCPNCRDEFDKIKLGAALARRLPRADAPPETWREIEDALKKNAKKEKTLFPRFARFSFRNLAVGLTAVCVAALLIYFGFIETENRETAKTETPILDVPAPTQNRAAWAVETLAGNEKVTSERNLTIGEILETDQNSRARIEVANIGNVEIAPNSRVKMVNSSLTEQRLALERGILRAQIFAPPRIFIVDTPSAKAIDLGCAYTLEVDRNGDNRLHVTSGSVALAEGGAEVVVPAGGIALTKRGKGLGTPFADNSARQFQSALYEFDFENGGRRALQIILKNATRGDALTLWHLLARAPENERGKVFDALARRVKPPASVTRRGVLNADKEMLDAWFVEVENAWFERYLER